MIPGNVTGDGIIIDHSTTKLASVPSDWITEAKENLHIAYSHTSHGSQLTYRHVRTGFFQRDIVFLE